MSKEQGKGSEQISMFALLEEYETPLLPVEQRNKGVKAWVIEAAGIKNSLEDEAPILFWVVRPRKVMFTNDARRDPRAYSGWFTAAESVGGQYFGWYGGRQHEPIFTRMPSMADMEKYVREQRNYKSGVEIRPW